MVFADDWPISYQQLDPFYNENDKVMGVAGLAGDPAYPPKEPTMPPVPMGKIRPTRREKVTTNSAGTGGLLTLPSQRRRMTAETVALTSATAVKAVPKGPRPVPM